MKPILVADDSPDDVLLFEHAAHRARIKWPLQFVSDGEEVVQYLLGLNRFSDRAAFPLPELLFLDNKMPQRSGLETLAWIRHRAPAWLRDLTVILLTSSQEESDVKNAYALGANGYLVKPTDNAILSEMISCVCEFWCCHNKLPAVMRTNRAVAEGFLIPSSEVNESHEPAT